MLDFKRFGKGLLCLALCLACLIVANPVSAMSTLSVPNTGVAVQPELVAPVEDHPSEAPAEKNDGMMVSYIRYSAYSGSTIIGCMENGTVVKVLGSKNSYYKINCYDMNGYIAKSQVVVNEAGEYVVQAVAGSKETAYLPTVSAQNALQMRTDLIEISQQYIGRPYVYGATGPRAFDCSGYTQFVYRKLGIELNRTAASQASNGIVVAREDMQPGDLVIFSNTDGYRFGTHVGLYLGNDKFIHAGASSGVCIADMNNSYWARYFECARRVILTDSSAATTMPSVGSITGSIGAGWRN